MTRFHFPLHLQTVTSSHRRAQLCPSNVAILFGHGQNDLSFPSEPNPRPSPDCAQDMETLSFLGKVYDLDTLDTRFTSSSTVPYQTVIDARSDAATSRASAAPAPSRAQLPKWRTPEFYLYYVVVALAIPYMFCTAYQVSRREWRRRRMTRLLVLTLGA